MINEEIKKSVWGKATTIEGRDPLQYRLDACGALIKYDDYGRRNSLYGWEIDHVVPKAYLIEHHATEEEIDKIENLRAINWKNNDSKGTSYPEYLAVLKWDGQENVPQNTVYEVNKDVQNLLKDLYGRYGI